MSLILWTSASASDVKSVIGVVIAQHQIPHRVVSDTSSLPSGVTKDDVVLAFGTKALAVLQEFKVIPKGRTVTSTREKMVVLNGVRYLVSFDPGVASRDYARLPEIQWDVQLAIRLHQTGGVKPILGDYRYVDSLHELIQEVEARYEKTGKAVELACDLETKSLNPYAPKAWIIAASFTIDDGKSDVLYFTKDEAPKAPLPWVPQEEMNYWEALWTQVHWILTTPKVSLRGANFKFDANWIFLKWGIACTNQKFDTMLVGSLLDENRSNSLKLHAKIMTPLGGYEDDMDKYDFSCLEVVPKPEMLQYVGGDTDVTYRVANVMRRDILKDPKLSNFYVKLVQPAAKAFEKLERNGVLVDRPYYDKLQTELEAEISRLQQEMLRCMPNKLRIKHKDSIADSVADGKSPFKPAILKEFLFTQAGLNLKPLMVTEKTKEPSTSMDHLMMFGDNPDAANFISFFKGMGSAQKTLSTYVVGFLKHLRADGRFHATYYLSAGDFGGGKDQGTNCLVGEAMVATIRGLVRVDSVAVGDKVLTHLGRWMPVTDFMVNGVKPILEIVVGERALRCTANHPLLTTLGWVFAEDIIPGFHQVICYNKETFLGENHGDLETSTRLSGVLHIQSREVENDHPTEGPLSGDSLGCGGEERVQVLHPEESCREGTSIGPQVSCVGIPSSPSWGVRGASLGWGSVELPLEELGLGNFQAERGGHGAARKEHGRYETPIPQINCGSGTSYRTRLGKSLWERGCKEAPSCRGHYIEDKEWRSLGFEANVVSAVNFIGELNTFDITVAEDHSFVVGGILTHNTGRTSASGPAIQTLPKHSKWAKRLRKAYIAPPGKAILNCDFSQGELRITAVVADEPIMLQAYRENKDLHAITASKLNGYEFDEFMLLPEDVRDELRSGGKAGNFGLIYGMQHKGFKEYAYLTYGVKMSEEEAFQSREAFFELYSRLPAWHEEYKAHAHNWGFVRSPLGRVRHLPLINSRDREVVAQSERQSINSPIQSCLSDMMQLAMVHIDREYGDQVEMFLMCHDALSLYVPEDDAVEWAKKIKCVMENLPLERDFGWRSPLKFTADAEVGLNLAELKKLKGL